MKPFSSIESLRHLIRNVRKYYGERDMALPKVHFTGHVKIHGTNAGVRVTPNKVQAQGRNRILDITSDNYGFAFWCSTREEQLRKLVNLAIAPLAGEHYDFTFFGEWCGKGIQAKVAVSEVPKHFVLFAIWDNIMEAYVPIPNILNANYIKYLNDAGIYFITQVPAYEIEIDFGDAEEASRKIIEHTLAVEEECPWGKFRGVSGIGEGIVWHKTDAPGDSHWWFKSKGDEHQKGKGDKKKTNVAVDTVKVNTIKALVDEIVPEGRLLQGISYLKENNILVDRASTGQYIGWVAKDTAKEESDVIADNGFEWRDVNSHIINKARQFFLTYLDTNHE